MKDLYIGGWVIGTMLDSSASQVAFVLSFSVSLALVLALVVSWPRLIGWLGRSWRRRFCLALSLPLPPLLLVLLFIILRPGLSIFPSFFGFLAALGASQLLPLSRRSQATIAASLPWLIIFLFSLIAGIYPDISVSLLSSLREARIEPTGIQFILAEERSRDPELPVFEFDARPLVTARTWAYKSAMQSLRNLTDDAPDETGRLRKYCNIKALKRFCEGFDVSDDMQRFLDATDDYFTAIHPLVQCLAAYGDPFPNGLPIQDELSEIAISFARRDKASDVNASHIEHELETLFANLVAGVANNPVEDQKTTTSETAPLAGGRCKAQLTTGLRSYYDSKKGWIEPGYEQTSSDECKGRFDTWEQQLGCRVWKLIEIAGRHWRQNWKNREKPPYRALLETYVITAAGYPEDAAYNAGREYDSYKKQGMRNYGRLIDWVFSLRMLHAREHALEEAGDFKAQSYWLDKLGDEYHNFFKSLVGTTRINVLLKYCSAGWGSTDLLRQISEPNEAADVRDFLSRTLFFHMREELRRWQTQNMDENYVTIADLRETGDEFATVFADPERVFEGCRTGWERSLPEADDIEDQIDRMHAEFGLTSGAIKLAELVRAIGRREEYGGFTVPEKSMLLCAARDQFEALRDEQPGSGAEEAWQKSVWERAIKFIEAVNARKPQC
jgi:hypothetical protein